LAAKTGLIKWCEERPKRTTRDLFPG